jgi:ketosteroid isomerase-like protein
MRRILVIAALCLYATSVAAQEPTPMPSPAQPATQDAKQAERERKEREKQEAKAAKEKAKQEAKAAKEAEKAAQSQATGEKVAMSGSAEQELTQLDREWTQASVSGDASILESVLADDYSTTGTSGNAITKAEAIAELKSGATKLESNDTDNYKVRVFGDTAVMTHDGVRKGQRQGQAFTERYRSLHVFVKRGGRWQVVASQGTTLPQQ